MLRKGLLLAGLLVAGFQVVKAQKQSPLDSFFITAHVFSDAAPHWFEYILEVAPVDGGARVRHMRLAPASAYCPNDVTVRAIEKTVEESPVQLGSKNLCSMKEADFQRTIKRVSRKSVIDDTVGYTIVATCSGNEKIFDVPYLETLDTLRLKMDYSGAADIVYMYAKIEERVFPADHINGEEHPRDHELQLAAQEFIPELRSGRFDKGFYRGLSGILGMYHGPIQTSSPPVPKLMDGDRWKFARYVNPVYPILARQARVQGKVELELSVDATSGQVLNVTVLQGNGLLVESAITAAKQWVLDPGQSFPNSVEVTLDYALICSAVPLEIQQ